MNGVGYSELDKPIRARFQRLPLFLTYAKTFYNSKDTLLFNVGVTIFFPYVKQTKLIDIFCSNNATLILNKEIRIF